MGPARYTEWKQSMRCRIGVRGDIPRSQLVGKCALPSVGSWAISMAKYLRETVLKPDARRIEEEVLSMDDKEVGRP